MTCPECNEPLRWENDWDNEEDMDDPKIESMWSCDECEISVIKVYHVDPVTPYEGDLEDE